MFEPIRNSMASKAERAVLGYVQQWIIFDAGAFPEYPGLYVLKVITNGDIGRVVKTSPTLDDLHAFIPEGYANTGVPVAPMLEVWV